MSVGDNIRFLRKKQGFTLKELADRIPVAENTLHQYETGKRAPDPDMMRAIAGALEAEISELFGDFRAPRSLNELSWRTLSDRHACEFYESVPSDVVNWLENFQGMAEEAGYPGFSQAGGYGFMLLEEFWHSDQTDEIARAYREDLHFPSSAEVLGKLRGAALDLQRFEPDALVFVGEGTGAMDSHEIAIFFPFGTSGERYKEVIASYHRALEEAFKKRAV